MSDPQVKEIKATKNPETYFYQSGSKIFSRFQVALKGIVV